MTRLSDQTCIFIFFSKKYGLVRNEIKITEEDVLLEDENGNKVSFTHLNLFPCLF